MTLEPYTSPGCLTVMHKRNILLHCLSYHYFEFSGTIAAPILHNTGEIVNIRAHRKKKYYLAVGMM